MNTAAPEDQHALATQPERQTLSRRALRGFDPLYDEEYTLTKQQFYNLISAVISGLLLEDITGEYIKRIWFTSTPEIEKKT